MFKKYIIYLLCFLWLTPGFAASADSELMQLLNGINSMSANFIQTTAMSGKHPKKQQLSGTIALIRPGKLRWEVKQPNRQLIIVNQKIIWVYDMDLEQISKRKLDYLQPGNPTILLSGNTSTLQNLFNITKLQSTGSTVWFQLNPKTPTNMYQWIKVCFADHNIIAMNIADNLGGQTAIHFSAIKINTAINPNLFQFKVPEGVDVIETE
jgi:outer membrane lipoprotein carrier protein